jgi:rubrerythrin
MPSGSGSSWSHDGEDGEDGEPESDLPERTKRGNIEVQKMTNQDLNLLDAIQIAKEAERKAAAYYADAAERTSLIAKGLFEQLAEFERYHYEKLSSLEKSLRDEGAFIEYEGRELTFPARGEIENPIEGADMMSLMEIITMGVDIEREAEKRYAALAEQTADPAGRSMFERLAEEEHAHYRILRNAYWSLNDRGVWEWPKK